MHLVPKEIVFSGFFTTSSPFTVRCTALHLTTGSPFSNRNQSLDSRTSVTTLVVGGPDVLLSMWAAYSGLHQLHKPVDLIMLNSDEHVLTNPAVRMASQGGSVDWFRFWLQGYEDPDPAKAGQYKRWRELKKMQAESDKKSSTPEPSSN